MSRLLNTLVVVAVIGAFGCGTILNGSTSNVTLPSGATIDGVAGPTTVSNQSDHTIVYQDGRRCTLESKLSPGYIFLDILFFVGLVVDAVTGDWRVLYSGQCDGVSVD